MTVFKALLSSENEENFKNRIYYRSGTGIHYCIGAAQTFHHSPGSSTFQLEMTSWPPP